MEDSQSTLRMAPSTSSSPPAATPTAPGATSHTYMCVKGKEVFELDVLSAKGPCQSPSGLTTLKLASPPGHVRLWDRDHTRL